LPQFASWSKERVMTGSRPYKLRICDKCEWHTVQDKEHILLDCPHDILLAFAYSTILPSHLSMCLVFPLLWLSALFPCIFTIAFFNLVTGFSQASAQMPPEAYIAM